MCNVGHSQPDKLLKASIPNIHFDSVQTILCESLNNRKN